MREKQGISGWVKKALPQIWYSRQFPAILWAWFFLPLTLVFCMLVMFRRHWYKNRSHRVGLPIIVVGNISVGGSGKTPMVIFLVQQLQNIGLSPGVISRGYGSKDKRARRVDQLDPESYGDEAVLIASRTHCPVAVGHDRYRAAKTLLEHSDCNIIISDDGLQHYRLYRDMEIIVIDGYRGFGNGYCLPSGPLREKPHRLNDADFVFELGQRAESKYPMFEVKPSRFINLVTDKNLGLTDFKGQQVNAVAGIADPDRFFQMLVSLGIKVIKHRFPDHHVYRAEQLKFDSQLPIIMTEKDAVKCISFASDRCWYLRVDVETEQENINAIIKKTNKLLQKEA